MSSPRLSSIHWTAVLAAAVPALGLGQSLTATTVASGLTQPLSFVQDPSRRNVQFIVEQGGLIKVVLNGVVQATPYLDLSGSVVVGPEGGLLGMSMARDFGSTGQFYVNYTSPDPAMRLVRYNQNPLDPLVADPSTANPVLTTFRTQASHLAGSMQFGPDGMMYVPTGDGGGTGDPPNNAQNPNTLLGKMLRIDPRGDDFPADPDRNYHIPSDNPFVDGQPIVALPEIWSFGLRNPFKFSFDDPLLLGNGALVMGDVGQNSWEEVDYEPAGQGGNNYGWRRFEGFSQYSATPLAFGPATKPVYVYNHTIGVTVLGGRVYRGLELGADYFGRYFFGEFSFEKLFSMRIEWDPKLGKWVGKDLRDHSDELSHPTIGHVSSIDVDSYGELYIVDYSGKVTKLGRTNTTWLTAFTVQTGSVFSGSLRHVVAIDDRSLILRAQSPVLDEVVSTYVAKTNRPSPTTLTFDAVGRVTAGSTGLLRLLVRRWSDDQWVQVRAENMDGTRRRFRVTGLPASDYVRASDGRIEIRLSVKKKVPTADVFQVYWDQVVPRAD